MGCGDALLEGIAPALEWGDRLPGMQGSTDISASITSLSPRLPIYPPVRCPAPGAPTGTFYCSVATDASQSRRFYKGSALLTLAFSERAFGLGVCTMSPGQGSHLGPAHALCHPCQS